MIRSLPAWLLLSILAPALAGAGTLHVPGDHDTIQEGIDAASYGDSVLVAPGVYREECRETPYGPSMLVMRSGVTLTSSDGPEVTILDGGAECRVILCDNVDDEAAVLGFTIMGGKALGQELYEDHGGGVFCFHSSPLFADCSFLENTSLMGGGFACDHPSLPELLRCDFTGNSAAGGAGGGAAFLGSSTIPVTDCFFNGNDADAGGAMELSAATPRLSGCSFIQNSAADRGGAIHCRISSPTLTGCTLAWNSSVYGGAIFCEASSFVTITGCTFFGESASGDGSGAVACADGSFALLEKTIIAFAAEGRALSCEDGSGNATLQCCDLYGNQGGDWVGCIADQAEVEGNISVDPLFCEADAGDFSLADESPCSEENNPTCGQVGAWPVGCESPTAVRPETWGRIKTLYR